MLVPAVKGSERTLAPGVDVVLELVRMAVNEQFPSLMPTLYPGSMATGPKPYASLDEMWKAFGDLSNNKTPAINGEKMFSLPLSSSGMRSSAPSGPVPPVMGAATADCRPRRLHGRWGRAIIQLSCLGMTTRPNAGPSKSIIMRRFLPFALRLKPTLLCGAPLSRPPPAPLPSEKIGNIA